MSFTSGQVLTAAQLNDLDIDSLTVSGATSAQITFTSDGDDYRLIATGSPENHFRIYNVTDSLTRFLIDDSGKAVFGGQSGSQTARTPLTVVRDNKLGSSFTGTSEGEGLRVDQTSYTANNYVGLVEAAKDKDQSASHVRIAAQFTSGGSKLGFGTTNSYAAGVNNQAVTIDVDGDVGIGDTTPSYKLDVNGTGRFTGNLTLDGNLVGTSNTNFTVGNDSGEFILFQESSNSLYFQTNGTYRSYFTSGGDFVPYADNTYDLGSSSLHWAEVHAERYRTEDSDTYIEYDGDSGGGIDGPGIRFVINNSEMFKFLREGNNSSHSMLTFGETNDGILYEKDNEKFTFYRNGTQVFEIEESIYTKVSGASLLAASPPTGTGNDAEWAAPFGVYILRRNSSLAAEKENVTDDLGTHLTADMIDSVVPKMWNRIHAPGYPEIGPIAEDMDAISPFLAARGTTAEGDPFLTGINKTAYLSLLVLAVKDLRSRVATLEAA